MGTKHRKRLHRYEIANQPRFLTFSCYQRLPLLGNVAIRDAFVEHLRLTRRQHAFRLLAWVVMPEHVHLIMIPAPQSSSIAPMLHDLKSRFSINMLDRWKALKASVLPRLLGTDGSHHFWQAGGGYDRNIRDEDELREKTAYVHFNPVKRGLVTAETDWAWSSARWHAGMREGELPMDSVG